MRILLRLARSAWPAQTAQTARPAGSVPATRPPALAFSASARHLLKPMPPRPKPPPEEEMEEMFVKGTGPGGQKINKTNSAVQLKHLPTGIVVKSQKTRSRSQNRNHARELLAARLDELHRGDQSRTAIVGETKRRRRASADKKSRRKYRKLREEEEQVDQTGKGVRADKAETDALPEETSIEDHPAPASLPQDTKPS